MELYDLSLVLENIISSKLFVPSKILKSKEKAWPNSINISIQQHSIHFCTTGNLRLENEYEVDYENKFLIPVCRPYIITSHPSLIPEAFFFTGNAIRRSDVSGNVTCLTFKSRTRTQSPTRSPI